MPNREISILHIASDNDFINAANYIFEKTFPGCNNFIISLSLGNRKLKKVILKENIEIVKIDKHIINLILAKIPQFDCIILHGISELNSTIFLSAKEKRKFIGIIWGAELYNNDFITDRNLLGKFTASIKQQIPIKSLKERIKDIIKFIIRRNSILICDAIRQTSMQLCYFSSLYREEFDFFRERKVLSEKCCFIPFTYYPLEHILKGFESALVCGNDILLGNSASFTNNHLEAIDILRNLNIGTRKIVTPLSYGNSTYGDHIHSKGFEIFNSNFKPLRKYLPLDEYNKILQNCGIVVMNHYRQQAEGNVLAALWLGCKVYLSENNTLYYYLKRIGTHVYSIEKDLIIQNKFALRNLSINRINHNRNILKKEIGEDNVILRLKKGIYDHFLK